MTVSVRRVRGERKWRPAETTMTFVIDVRAA